MKSRFEIAALFGLVCFLSLSRASAESLQREDMIAICGDSITEQKLYSLYLADYFLMCQPATGLHAVESGVSGEMSYGFEGRIPINILPLKPTVTTVCFGMNDGQYKPADPRRTENFKNELIKIVAAFKAGGVRFIVLGSPPAVDPATFPQADMYNPALAELAKAAKEAARSQGVAYADVYETVLDTQTKAKAKNGPGYKLGGSGQHPSPDGHLVMAYAFLKALGCDGNIGTITLDMKSNEAQATDGHKIISVSNGTVEVESSRYPFCFYGNPGSPKSTSGIIEFMPFNQDLNRYLLVVKNAPSGRLKVTWGKVSKEYSAAELEKGINLAAEFLDNPFSAPFSAVEEKLVAEQNFETPVFRKLQHALYDFRQNVPEDEENVGHLEKSLYGKWQTLSAASSAAVVPVKHEIKVEPVAK